MHNIWETQNVGYRGGGCMPWKKFYSIIFEGAIIDFIMCIIRKTLPDSWIITTEQNVQFQEGYAQKNVNLMKFKMANLRPFFYFKMCNIWEHDLFKINGHEI